MRAAKTEIIGKSGVNLIRIEILRKYVLLDVVGYVVSFIPYYGQGDSQDLKYYELKLKDVKNQQVNFHVIQLTIF